MKNQKISEQKSMPSEYSYILHWTLFSINLLIFLRRKNESSINDLVNLEKMKDIICEMREYSDGSEPYVAYAEKLYELTSKALEPGMQKEITIPPMDASLVSHLQKRKAESRERNCFSYFKAPRLPTPSFEQNSLEQPTNSSGLTLGLRSNSNE